MIELIDAHIKARLEIIQFDGESLRVYDYDPEREHGETQYPCAIIIRHEVVMGTDDARPDCVLYTASEEETEITVPFLMGGGSLTGPVSCTRKPYPIPIDVIYEIQARATNKSHATNLLESIIAVFPPGYMPEIGSQFPLFVRSENANFDELEKPLFISAFMMTVYDLWIDRFEAETYQSIRTIDLDEETLE